MDIQHYKTITEYCKAIGIDVPKHRYVDIRSFEENMGQVVDQMPPFRHEFYSIAIRVDGGGKAITGHHTDFPEGVTVFFNSPFQILSWDIVPDWSGYYLMISQEFFTKSHLFDRLLEDFPFLKIDESIPFEIDREEVGDVLAVYRKIQDEYHSDREDSMEFIEAYILLLLNMIKRLFTKHIDTQKAGEHMRTADVKLLSRFQKVIKTSFYPDAKLETLANLHSPTYYAGKLNVHPNHLNAVVKGITGQTALAIIHDYILTMAKAELVQTKDSIKEIAYRLHFESPNNFSAFFKKKTGLTPLQYRRNA